MKRNSAIDLLDRASLGSLLERMIRSLQSPICLSQHRPRGLFPQSKADRQDVMKGSERLLMPKVITIVGTVLAALSAAIISISVKAQPLESAGGPDKFGADSETSQVSSVAVEVRHASRLLRGEPDRRYSRPRTLLTTPTQLSQADNTPAISRMDFPNGGRPSNLYELTHGQEEICQGILDALNTAHTATLRKSGSRYQSDIFLESKLSVTWRDLNDSAYFAAVVLVDANEDGVKEWIVRRVTWSMPRYREQLFWLDRDIEFLAANGRVMWPTIVGPQDESFRGPRSQSVYENSIALHDKDEFFRTPLRDMPVFLWEMIEIKSSHFVLYMPVKAQDPLPQRLTVRVLKLRSRRSADELCRLKTRSPIAGIRIG